LGHRSFLEEVEALGHRSFLEEVEVFRHRNLLEEEVEVFRPLGFLVEGVVVEGVVVEAVRLRQLGQMGEELVRSFCAPNYLVGVGINGQNQIKIY